MVENLTPRQNEPDEDNMSAANQLYNELSEVVPERDVELPADGAGGDMGRKSLTEREEESPNKSDVRIATETLFPDTGNKTLNLIQVSEIFPESYRPFQAMLVKDRIRNSREDESVVDIIAMVNTAESIAFSREGRFDELAIIGVANRAKADDNKNMFGA
jgi:hypothetical protein